MLLEQESLCLRTITCQGYGRHIYNATVYLLLYLTSVSQLKVTGGYER